MRQPVACLIGILPAAVAAISSAARGQPPADYQGSCTDAKCHAPYKQRAVTHDPVAQDLCDACHQKTGSTGHRFELTATEPDLCTDCHDEEEFEGKVRHGPVADGQCTACHDPHGSEAEKLLVKPTVARLCEECHDPMAEDRSFVHGPVAVGACTSCHDPHASDHPAMLFAEGRDLCLKCHTALSTRMAGATYKHAPATEECTTCHDPHGTDNRLSLLAKPPELCVDCHDDIGELMEDAPVQHDALTAGKSCVGCHDPHSSNVEHSLIREPMDLCLTCHDKELDSGDGKVISIAALLDSNPAHHGPIRQKNCAACHQVHGGDNFRMLIEAYPPEFYVPFKEERYGLCFSCHEADMVRDPRTDKLTNFRNGDQNLHCLHVNRAVKGRTCRACHETHASKRPRHIAESVPFGEWRIPINFTKTPSGGSCAPGCHRQYRYDRDNPVENMPGQPGPEKG